MRYFITSVFLLFYTFSVYGQEPFLMNGANSGVGQYGYIEAQSLTFNRINSNTFNNIFQLAARWWAEGTEFIYYTPDNLSCGTEDQSTNNFNHNDFPNWDAGEFAFVSVYAQYCGSPTTWSHTPGSGLTGFNERRFLKIEVDNAYSGALSPYVVDNPTGTQNVVGSFTIDAGTYTSGNTLTLDRLWVENIGTAGESTDIPNDGLYLYYEPITGSEVYDGDGSESSAILYGDYDLNATNNNEYGNTALGINIPASGLRFYLVINDLIDTYTPTNAVLFQIMNDGISFQENQDGHNKMRIVEMDISNGTFIPLPVELLHFEAQKINNHIELNWATASEINNDYFVVERSIDNDIFIPIGVVEGRGNTTEHTNYQFIDFEPHAGANYYRLRQVDFDGYTSFSKTLAITVKKDFNWQVYPNPVQSFLNITIPEYYINYELQFLLYNELGQLIKDLAVMEYQNTINLDVFNLSKGVYWLQIRNRQTGELVLTQSVVK